MTDFYIYNIIHSIEYNLILQNIINTYIIHIQDGSEVSLSDYCGKVKTFLKAPGSKIGKLVNVSTAAMIESTYKKKKSIAVETGIPIDEREFHCRGSFTAMHKGKLDQSDIENVKIFVKKITK